MKKILVCSDLHGALKHFEDAFRREAPVDMVIMAGDIGIEQWKIDRITGLTACAAVQGNNDRLRRPDLPVKREFSYEGFHFLITHGHTMGVGRGTPRKFMALTRNLGADIIVFGHSHAWYLERVGDVLYLNPGTMAGNAFTFTYTYAILTLDQGTVKIEKREYPVQSR